MNWYQKSIMKIAGVIPEEQIGSKREFAGLVINIERAAGTDRYGVNKEGEEWRTKMMYDYGFIASAKGEDGEGLDVYLGPNEKAKSVYIVHQNSPKTGKYDEDKVMVGFDSASKAKKGYLAHYDSPKFFGGMSEISFDEFKDIIENHKEGKVAWKKAKELDL
jgi:inorganic pyrophosphatase